MSTNDSDDTDQVNEEILGLTFNQNFTALTMGTVERYSLFSIHAASSMSDECDYEIKRFQNSPSIEHPAVYIAERLFSSSLLILVTTFHFSTTIYSVKVNRSSLIVCLQGMIHIYEMTQLRGIHVIRDLPTNINFLCALSSQFGTSYLAYTSTNGRLQIFDTINLTPVVLIDAHNYPLAGIIFNQTGTRIASVSTHGKIIRVHQILDGALLFEFRREVQQHQLSFSLAFSPDSMFLAVSSSANKIHVFQLVNPTTGTSEVLAQAHGPFTTIHLSSSSGKKTTMGMTLFDEKLILFVANYDGILSAYKINTISAGEYQQLRQIDLLKVPVSYPVIPSTAAAADQQNTTDDPGQSSSQNLVENECEHENTS